MQYRLTHSQNRGWQYCAQMFHGMFMREGRGSWSGPYRMVPQKRTYLIGDIKGGLRTKTIANGDLRDAQERMKLIPYQARRDVSPSIMANDPAIPA